MVSTYSYVRFRWWKPIDLSRVVEDLSAFKTNYIVKEGGGPEITLFKDLREEVMVEADTLQVMISPLRAVLNQREAKPFTSRDLELREKIMKMYPQDRPTPFPWEFSLEPKYMVQ